MSLSLSREFLFTAACSIWPPSGRRTRTIYEAAANPFDWSRLPQIVERHRVAGLVYDGITRTGLPVPPAIVREIATQAERLVRQNLAHSAEALRLRRLFSEAALPVVFLKGVSVAKLAYGNLALRHSWDIDLLVQSASAIAAAKLLEDAGYHRVEPPLTFDDPQLQMWLHRCKELRFVHVETQVVVELHCRLFDNPRLASRIPNSSSLRLVAFAEGAEIPTLGEKDLFAYLCAHGAVHSWFRLKWLADIGALVAQQAQDDVEQLYLEAEARGAGPAAAQALLLCRQLLGTSIPKSLVATLSQNSAVRWLNAISMRAMTADREPTAVPFGTTLDSVARFLLGRNWDYWLAEIGAYATSPPDILMLPLPKRLKLFYPALRLPLWILRRGITACSHRVVK